MKADYVHKDTRTIVVDEVEISTSLTAVEIASLQQENQELKKQLEELQKENEKLHHYKTLYQSLKKQKEELRSWLKEDNDKIKVYDTKNNKAVELGIVLGLGMCVDKMEELESVKK
ncbi:MAG: hypothetical protein ACI31R_05570 [Bacilli bacterium]